MRTQSLSLVRIALSVLAVFWCIRTTGAVVTNGLHNAPLHVTSTCCKWCEHMQWSN